MIPGGPVGGRTGGRSEQAARDLLRDLGHDVVEHGLRRRRALAAVTLGQASAWDLCDAHPHLLAAARHHGTATSRPCPLGGHGLLVDVHFVYGEALRQVAGQAKTPPEIRRLATVSDRAARSFDVYVVEVCPHCRWNHLLRSFVVGGDARGHSPARHDDDGRRTGGREGIRRTAP